MVAPVIPGIYAKIAAVQRDIGNVPKNGKGPAAKGGFEYVKFDDILASTRDLFVSNGIITEVETLEHNVHVEVIGTRMVVNTNIKVRYTYIDIEDGSRHSTTVGGEGNDIGGDLATRKAYTQALKIALLQTFNIVTGDEIDSDGAAVLEVPAAPDQTKTAATTNVDDLKAQIGAVIGDENSPYDGDAVNALGDKLTGKKRAVWFNDAKSLQLILDGIAKGEVG